MSKKCDNRNPLLRDGTSQAQRVLKALLPGYVAVDERKMEDLIAFAKKFATEIKFFDLTNTAVADWVAFFTKTLTEDQRNEPHYALFIAFLELYKVMQDDINTITKRHLDFYYRDVLRLEERPAAPDQVFMIFKLVEFVGKSLVAKGTLLDAGKDALGNDLRYALDKDIVVNQAKVESLKSVFINNGVIPPNTNIPYNYYRLYASPVANSADGKGADLEGEEKSWKTFGKPANEPLLTIQSPGDVGRNQADVGFAFASPILYLGEGQRTVTVTLSFDKVISLPAFNFTTQQAIVTVVNTHVTMAKNAPLTSFKKYANNIVANPIQFNAFFQLLQKFFNVSFSGEKEWITPDSIDNVTIKQNEIKIVCTIGKGQKPVVTYNKETLLDPFVTQWPVMKVILNKDSGANPYFYQQFKVHKLVSAEIEVDVTEMKGLVLQNDDSILKAEQPFYPFGNRPVLGSTFYIGSTEVFQKKLTGLKLDIDWHGIPQSAIDAQLAGQNGFFEYYHNYLPARTRGTYNFTVDVDILDKRAWMKGTSEHLFNSGLTNNAMLDLTNQGSQLPNVNRDPFMEPVEEFGPDVKKGFIRLKLTGVDFGHQEFQNSFSVAAINAAKTGGDTSKIPNEPYTPTIKDITLSYKSAVVINLDQTPAQRTQQAFDNRIDQFFHVLPFGVAERHPYLSRVATAVDLLPQFDEEGTLYIGLRGLEAPAVLSLLFKVSEGSADPDLDKQPVIWSFMSNNEWVDFNKLQLLSDSTNGLLTSGIVSFDVPKAITSNNTAFNSDLYWIRAAVATGSSAICDMIDIQAQAVTATFLDNANDPNHLAKALPAKTISAIVDGNADIEETSQPYASFGGHMKEDSTSFYVRVSERLRHKHRAVTMKDYELLVLEHFPKIYKVKCLNHTYFDTQKSIHEKKPGHVSLVIISNLRNKNAVNPLKPKTSLVTLTEISQYIKALNPPCPDLHVRNPIFEEIEMDFSVRFLPGYDNGFYGQQLDADIRQFLAPWAFDGGKDLLFGGKIHKSVVLNFVEERPYVDFVTCFNMNQYIPGDPAETVLKNIDEAQASTSASILTSRAKHKITVLETDDCGCPDNDVKQPFLLPPSNDSAECGVVDIPEKPNDGIGADTIGTDFIVGHAPDGDGIGFWTIESDFNVQ